MNNSYLVESRRSNVTFIVLLYFEEIFRIEFRYEGDKRELSRSKWRLHHFHLVSPFTLHVTHPFNFMFNFPFLYSRRPDVIVTRLLPQRSVMSGGNGVKFEWITHEGSRLVKTMGRIPNSELRVEKNEDQVCQVKREWKRVKISLILSRSLQHSPLTTHGNGKEVKTRDRWEWFCEPLAILLWVNSQEFLC